MKLLQFLIAFLLSCPVAGQSIKGRLLADGQRAGVPVMLEGTAHSTVTDEKGAFILDHVAPGTYLLIAGEGTSATARRTIVVGNEDLVLEIALTIPAAELDEVVVAGNRGEDRATAYAARLPVRGLEHPQAVNYVSQTTMASQAVLDYDQALRNVPGVTKAWASTKAFYYSRGFSTRVYMRNGVAAYSTADADMANMEQLQVIKGPSGTLFGSTLVSFGGLINRITQKPFDSTRVEAGYQCGSYHLSRYSIDINTPLSRDKNVLFRLNAAHHYSGSFQDAGFTRNTFIAPALTYRPGERLSISLEAEVSIREATAQLQVSPPGSGPDNRGADRPSSLPLDYKRAYSNNSVRLKDPSQAFFGQVTYRLSPRWTSTTHLVHTHSENAGDYLTFQLLKGDSLMVRNVNRYPLSVFTVSQLQQNFTGDFRVGSLRNRMVAGIDIFRNVSNTASNALGSRGRPSFDTLNLRQAMPGYAMITPSLIDRKLEPYAAEHLTSEMTTYAAYVSNVVNLTEALSMLLGLRADLYIGGGTVNTVTDVRTGAYRQAALSPRLGVVYEAVRDRLSFFGNYMNGFQNVTPVTQPDGSISVFKPQYANQAEVGVKTELAKGVLSATLSVYDIRVKNAVRAEAARPTFRVQEGTQYSRGLELDIASTPLPGLLFSGGLAWNDSRITSGEAALDGLRTPNAGPEKTFNFYARYQVGKGKLAGFGCGLGGNYSSSNGIINNRMAGQFYLPSYTVLQAGLFFTRTRYRVSLNVDNLTNCQYYTGGFGTFTPGMLRRFTAGLHVSF